MLSPLRSLVISGVLAACCLEPALAQMTMTACHQMGPDVPMPAPKDLPPPQKMTGVGNLHFPISSKNPETQMWFDQGINLVYDFWDYEAERAFEQAVRTDANCAICHWALAQAMGFGTDEMNGYIHDEVTQAANLRKHADKREKLYIDAAQAEFPAAVSKLPAGDGDKNKTIAILRQIVAKYSNDPTAKLMLVETIEDGYDRDTGKPKAGTAEAINILQGILQSKPDDSAANHLWIHAVEASPHPEQALDAAKKLGGLAPESGHMTHMPGHIFYRVGDYERAQQSFDWSTKVDEAYLRGQHVDVDDDWNYVHNLMYSIANLLEQGRMLDAASASKKLTTARGRRAATLYPWSTRDAITRLDPMLPLWLRSANWEAVNKTLEQAPGPSADLPTLRVLSDSLKHFAEGMIAADAKDYTVAEQQSAAMDAELWRLSQLPKKEKKEGFGAASINYATPTDPNAEAMLKNLAVLSLELRAAVMMGSGKIAAAQTLLTQARKNEVDLGYHEPPAFIQPVAEFEAALLVKAGRREEAQKAWKQALLDRPNSGYPLYGMAEMAAAADDQATAREDYARFLAAWKNADDNLPQVIAAREWMQAHPAAVLASVQ